jgi:predicted nucleic acid-binding protein
MGQPLMLLLDTNILIGLQRARRSHRPGLKTPDAIILAPARCADLSLATRNSRNFPPALGSGNRPQGIQASLNNP